MLRRLAVTILLMGVFLPECAFSEEILLQNTQNYEVELDGQIKTLKGSLFVNDTQSAQIIVNKQQEADMEDLESIWEGTVNNNPLIKFTLQKLAIPEEERRVHSSLLAKSMSAIISGASMLPSFMGMNYGIQSASFASARLAHNLLNKKNAKILQESPLTDTEAIELAGLIEDLQGEIVTTYYCYKHTLQSLKDTRAELILLNKNYANAISSGDKLEITVTSARWEEKQIEEYKLKQEAKRYYLMLQRLAGKETVDNLNVAVYDLSTINIDPNDIDFSKKEIKVKTP